MGNPSLIDLDSMPYKLNWQLIAILPLSILIYICFNIKITLYKSQVGRSVAPIPKRRSGKPHFINSTIENQKIADFVSDFSGILVIGLIPIYSSMVNKISLSKLSEYPNYHVMHFFNLIFPPMVNGVICMICYGRNKPLRSAVTKELLNFLNRFHFFQT
jgi:hypothetical protein